MPTLVITAVSLAVVSGLHAAGTTPEPAPLLDPGLAGLLPLAWVCVGLVILRRVAPPPTARPARRRRQRRNRLAPAAR